MNVQPQGQPGDLEDLVHQRGHLDEAEPAAGGRHPLVQGPQHVQPWAGEELDGGQVQVEILDVSLSPARFITDYIAGLYHRPLLMPDQPKRLGETIKLMPNAPKGLAALYVNRGIGTVGAPVRLGAPPEISHIVLRRA